MSANKPNGNGQNVNPKAIEAWINNLRHSYGKSRVSEDVMAFIVPRIQHIPRFSWKWISEEFSRVYDKCPDQLHTAILNMWHRWRSEHPEQCSNDPNIATQCRNENCHGGWMLWWRREGSGTLMSFAAPCGDCRRSGNSSVRPVTWDRALELGWYPDCSENRSVHAEEIADAVRNNLESHTKAARRMWIEETRKEARKRTGGAV